MGRKYGNIEAGIPAFYGQEKEAILKAVADGTIDAEKGRSMVLDIQHQANAWIVATNGGYTLPSKRRKRVSSRMRKVLTFLQTLDKMKAEKEETPEGEQIDTPATLQPEPIDTPSRDPVKPVDPEENVLDKLQPLIDEALGVKSETIAS